MSPLYHDNMDTNLYDFLRDIHTQAQGPHGDAVISEAQWNWLESYLRNPGVVIEFRARETGRLVAHLGDPELEQHYALAGTPQEVFELLGQAMTLNPTFAQIVISASRAYLNTARLCRRCSQRHFGRSAEDCPNMETPSWEFKQREP